MEGTRWPRVVQAHLDSRDIRGAAEVCDPRRRPRAMPAAAHSPDLDVKSPRDDRQRRDGSVAKEEGPTLDAKAGRFVFPLPVVIRRLGSWKTSPQSSWVSLSAVENLVAASVTTLA